MVAYLFMTWNTTHIFLYVHPPIKKMASLNVYGKGILKVYASIIKNIEKLCITTATSTVIKLSILSKFEWEDVREDVLLPKPKEVSVTLFPECLLACQKLNDPSTPSKDPAGDLWLTQHENIYTLIFNL